MARFVTWSLIACIAAALLLGAMGALSPKPVAPPRQDAAARCAAADAGGVDADLYRNELCAAD